MNRCFLVHLLMQKCLNKFLLTIYYYYYLINFNFKIKINIPSSRILSSKPNHSYKLLYVKDYHFSLIDRPSLSFFADRKSVIFLHKRKCEMNK